MITLTLLTALAAATALVLFLLDWGGAQRRELLYFALALEKPGSAYFREARAGRAQHSRLALAMLLLTGQQVLLLHAARYPTLAAGGFDASLATWFGFLGLTILAYALLFPSYGERMALPVTTGAFSAVAIAFIFYDLWVVVPAPQLALLPRALQAMLALGAFGVMRSVPAADRNAPPSVFLLWLVGPVLDVPWLHQIAMTSFLALLGFRAYRERLDRDEALETDRYRMQRQREVIVSFLDRIGGAYSDALNLGQVLRIIAEAGVETTSAGSGAIYLIDTRTRELHIGAAEGHFPPLYRDVPVTDLRTRSEELADIAAKQRFAVGEGVVGEVAVSGKPLRVADAAAAGILVGNVADPVRRHPMLLVPLILRDEVLGVMVVLNKRNADEFSEEDQFLLGTLAEQAAFYIDNARMVAALASQERMRREIQIAREIQHLLLPEHSPNLPGFDLHALGRPALEMGGDYYDFFPVGDGLLGIVVADVSGKGVPAALTMAMLRTVVRAHAINTPSVVDVLDRANAVLSEDLPRDTFITICYGILDTHRRVFTFGRAGHEPVLLVRDGRVEPIAPAGAAFGLLHPEDFRQTLQVQEQQLQAGDAVVLYSDGITEAMDAAGEEFGMERFAQALEAGKSLSSKARVQCVDGAISAFVAEAPQQDDITLVVLTVP